MDGGDWAAAVGTGVTTVGVVGTWIGLLFKRRKKKQTAFEQARLVTVDACEFSGEKGFRVVNRGDSPIHNVGLATTVDGGEILALRGSAMGFNGPPARESAKQIDTIEPESNRSIVDHDVYQLVVNAQPAGTSSEQVSQIRVSFRDSLGNTWQRVGAADPTEVR